jgi:hypothetical protein
LIEPLIKKMMFEQLTQLVQEFGQNAVVKNDAIPNEQNEAVMKEAESSIFSSLQKMVAGGDLSQLAGLLQSNNLDSNNPAVKEITNSVSNSLTEKFGLSSVATSGAASNMVPQILSSLVKKANDPKDSSLNVSDIINSITGGSSAENAGIMEMISTYGIHFGLDQNADGKVDVEDAIQLTKKGGLAGMFAKLFGK